MSDDDEAKVWDWWLKIVDHAVERGPEGLALPRRFVLRAAPLTPDTLGAEFEVEVADRRAEIARATILPGTGNGIPVTYTTGEDPWFDADDEKRQPEMLRDVAVLARDGCLRRVTVHSDYVHIYSTPDGMTVEQLADYIMERWSNNDGVIVVQTPGAQEIRAIH